ncbi:maintenance of telomere capping protein 1 [Aspergillus udagawae]|uniref:Maintenance of telomere capping protein 1 n=1 Tax=Aspergillus udagawae TaxID=91492 RepID=A0ABQ1BBV9_9EURO|nr:maintenance of telomere capping protein 1 [Aspergillus udagawae]GFF97970.1 maintenance of telomere capping protein 1 [Aspergillus udagawae]GFG23479.1 maintenance of telomere capping protein 1 [Aspergillus udagawae]
MPPKGAKPTSDELLAQFDDLGIDSTTEKQPSKPTAASTTAQSEQDILAELDNLASQRPSSGPGTPRLSTNEPRPATKSPKPAAVATPRSSEDKPASRKSGESVRSARAGNKPTNTQPSGPEKLKAQEAPASGGGGWWGGIFATATAAMKQAEAAVKEIQQNEEAQKWAQQVRGNVGALRDLGGELKNKALPTFTSLLHTIAPPISSHERLQIHVTHDISGYPAIDPIVYSVFSRVMTQVEGGDLLVIQRGQESAPKRGLDLGTSFSTAGWQDGPWWRTVTPGTPRSISAVRGIVEATKLARASAESYATEYFASRGGVEEAAKQATQDLSESNPVRSSDIFLAIQAISQTSATELFQAGPTTEMATPPGVVDVPEATEEEVAFAFYLHDPIHGIAFHTISQTIPQKWIDWLDTEAPAVADLNVEDAKVPRTTIPEDIAEIVASGAVDPREWVAEWLEESLALAIGVVAQRYVARRMGVGEGGPGKGKMRAEHASVVESGAGEAARAL